MEVSSKKPCLDKICSICQAPARCQNYGVTSCEACKSFFRRANRGDAHKSYRCLNDLNCTIDDSNRKSCNYCRYQRCVHAGMNANRGWTDQERTVYLIKKRTRCVLPLPESSGAKPDLLDAAAEELYKELVALTSPKLPTLEDKGKFFSVIEIFNLDSLWSRFSNSFHNIPVNEEVKQRPNPYDSLENSFSILSAIAKRMFFFATSITQFTEINPTDKNILFLTACSELCMLNATLAFNKEDEVWLNGINTRSKFYKDVPGMKTETIIGILGPELYEDKLQVTLAVQRCRPDEVTVMLMFAILLFTPTRPGLNDAENIKKKQIYFTLLLKKYILWRFGEAQGKSVFRDLTSTLKNFRRTGPTLFKKLHGPMLRHARFNFLVNQF